MFYVSYPNIISVTFSRSWDCVFPGMFLEERLLRIQPATKGSQVLIIDIYLTNQELDGLSYLALNIQRVSARAMPMDVTSHIKTVTQEGISGFL